MLPEEDSKRSIKTKSLFSISFRFKKNNKIFDAFKKIEFAKGALNGSTGFSKREIRSELSKMCSENRNCWIFEFFLKIF